MFKPVPALIMTATLSAMATPAFGKGGVSLDDEGLQASVLNGDVKLSLGGKLHLDALTVDDEGATYSDAAVRRARIDMRIEYRDVLTLRAEREFAGSKGWRNLYATVRPASGVLVQAGQFNVPFSLEDMQSTNAIPFPERSLAAALTSEFALGVQGGYSGKRFTARLGYFGDALDTPTGPSPTLGRGVAGRATFLAVDTDRTKLHLGIGLERRSYKTGDTLRLSVDGGSTLGPRVLRTPLLGNLDHRTGYNAEFGAIRGGLAMQAQYIRQDFSRTNGTSRSAAGGYAQASWLVTGQSYRYSRSSGTLAGPELDRKGKAVELAARLSWLDASNANFDGGIARSIDLSAGLYLGRNLRLMASGTHARYRQRISDPVRHALIGVMRLQIAF